MPRILKYLLIAVAALVVLLVAAIAIIAATFNPNDYKPRLIETVQNKTHRTLSIPGDIKLTFLPRVGADLGRIALSEYKSDQPFASAEQMRISVALLPLFSKQVVVDRVLVDGMSVRLHHRKDGSNNYDDLIPRSRDGASAQQQPTPTEPGQPLRLDIGGVDINDASLSYTNESTQRKLAVSGFKLHTGPIAQGKASRIELAARVEGNQPQLALQLGLEGGFTPDLVRRHLVFDGLQASVNGNAAGLTNLQAKLSAPSFELSPSVIKAAALTLDAAMMQDTRKLSAKLTSAVQGDLTARHFELSKLRADLHLPNPAGGELTVLTEGLVTADLATEAVQVALTGQLDSTRFDAKAGLSKFDQPAYTFDVALSELDVDRYLPRGAKPAPAAVTSKSPAAEQPIDLSALKTLIARGKLKVDRLKIAGVKATDIRLELKAAGGKAEINPLSATLYGGNLNGSMSASAGSPQRLAAAQNLRGIHIGPLLKDAIDKQPIDGTGDVKLDIDTSGATVSQFKKGLNGTASLALKDGAINGINIAAALRNAKSKLGLGAATSEEGTASAQQKTDFTELGASFKIAKGIAHNEDLSAKTPLLRLGGSGDINIGEDRLDYTVKATVVPTLQGQGGPELEALKGLTIPVRVSGPYSAIGWKVDLGSMAGARAKELLEEKKTQIKSEAEKKLEEEKSKLQERLKGPAQDRLKGLLGR